ncbi:cytochrome P450 2D14-like isoform X2 [Cherax quadricarinatus]|uniref:cytochrome P450 2D14-like isoform X2 n=1 Tax=Cherax quadricarinatus TaxID=27406 RepID=UPI00387EC6D7
MALEWMGKMPGWEGIVLLGLLLFLLLIFVAPGRRPPNFPPGMPMLPVVGSLLHIRGVPLRTLLRNLKKEYGNMASFGIFGTGVVLISGLSTIKEVYTHKASADKPPMVLNATRNYLLSDGQAINLGLLGGNGQTWQELRRFVLRHLRDFGFGKTSCEPLIVKEVTELMDHIQQQEGQPIVMKGEVENFISSEDCDDNHSLASLFLKEIQSHAGEKSIFNMSEMRALVFEMFTAGMDTTSSTLTMGVYLIAKHSAVQQKVQQELDEVVGRDRLPSYSDVDQLPYTRATIHEAQRFFDLIAIFIRCAAEDCKFAGYDIPKGTVLLANAEEVMSDPKLWKNPHEFDPENFLNAEGKYVKNEGFFPFGIGRRVCVGESLARMQIFVFLASLFQRFTFSLVGEEVIPTNNNTFSAPVIYSAVAHLRPPL